MKQAKDVTSFAEVNNAAWREMKVMFTRTEKLE
jgi:hypothetical protein